MDKEKLWEKLNNIMEYYVIEHNHIDIISVLSTKYLTNFPEHLPIEIKNALEFDKTIVLNEPIKKDKQTNKTQQYSKVSKENIFDRNIILKEISSFPILKLIDFKKNMEERFKRKTGTYYDFIYTINAIIVIMFNSLIDGFLKQIIDLVLELDTTITAKIKGTSFEKRMDFLIKECKIAIQENEVFMRNLTYLQQIRHIFVHNNGIIDKPFLEETKIEGLKIGYRLVIPNAKIVLFDSAISWLVLTIFYSINEKYFKEYQKTTLHFEFTFMGFKKIGN